MIDATNRERLERVRRWLEQVRPFSDATHPLGRAARLELPTATGLHAANVEWALTQALEFDATDAELQTLVDSFAPAPAAHVLLSANVFASAVRAIAIALASTKTVSVRSSRREPLTAALLQRAAPDAFHLVTALRPVAGDHVWAYGADATLSQFQTSLPAGVVLHGHGDGFGVAVVDAPARLTPSDFEAIALDIAAFDQRGCLSPRFVLLEGTPEQARGFAARLLAALNRLAVSMPLGTIDPETNAASARHRELWRYLGEVYAGPGGMVTLDVEGNPRGEPPANRTVHVRSSTDALTDLVGWSGEITAVASRRDPALSQRLQRACPEMRWSPFGFMQRPRLDGPADRRGSRAGIVL